MDFKPLFYACLVLCVIVFFEVLVNLRKNPLLKVCFLLIIVSLFVMNYFSYVTVGTRVQFVFVKFMRLVYVCSTMLAVVHLVTSKIPRWLILLTTFAFFFFTGLRIFKFNDIDIESQAPYANQIFSIGREFHTPSPMARNIALVLVSLAVVITFYHYRKFLLKINRENTHSGYLSGWIISIVLPFFLLTIFGVLGLLNVFQPYVSPLLFSLFSCTIIFSILLRPRFLNDTAYGVGLFTSPIKTTTVRHR